MLTIEEAREAYRVGLKRYRYSVKHGIPQAGNYKRSSLDPYKDGMAAVAEATAAEVIGRRWLANWRGPDKGADIEGGFGVRWTPKERWGLVINGKDRDLTPMILVVGKTYPLRVVGWFRCGDGRINKYVKHTDRATIWIVPQADLKPIGTLR
jgi:hypothetical protein